MDHWFDTLTKSLARGTLSRRAILEGGPWEQLVLLSLADSVKYRGY